MATLTTVRLNKNDAPSWGFRLQGGKDFGTPLVIQKVNGGSPAERAGLSAGDAVIKINNTDVFNLTHKDAQDVILRSGNSFDMSIARGGSTWKPHVIPTGKIPKPTPAINNVSPVTKTSLAAKHTENIGAIGTGHNNPAKPFVQNGGLQPVKYNCPIKLYSEDALAETIAAQTEVLQGGALGVNFKKNEKDYDVTNSAVYRMLKEAENDTGGYNNHHEVKPELNQNQKKEDLRAEEPEPDSGIVTAPNRGIAGLKHVEAPVARPPAPSPQIPPGQNICADCERLIVGVFVRIKDKNLHVECFKCSTCGSSLKNVGYYNINNKLYCDVHAKAAAISSNNAPAPGLSPVILPPGGRAPAGAISAALSGHSLPSSGPLSPPYQPPAEVTNGPSPVHSAPASNFNALKLSESTTNTNKISTTYNSSTPLSFSKYINKSQTNLSGPRPFSSVSAPLSPGGTRPRAAPLSPPVNHFNKAPLSPPVNHFNKAPLSPPTHQPFSPVSSVGRAPSFKNTSGGLFKEPVTWPPPKSEEEETAATACPLFYPPPSQIEAEVRLKQAAKQLKYEEEDNDFYEEENLELRKINTMDETSSYYSDEFSLSGRRSTTECVEIVSEHLDTQRMVERMTRLTPQLVPKPLELEDIEILRQEKERDTNQCVKSNNQKPVEPIIPETTPDQPENKINLPVPKKWESTLTQAARTDSPAPDTFAQLPSTVIPNYRPVSPFVSALVTAPAEPFSSVSNNAPDDIPLPEFTEPYIPPNHPVIHEKTDDELAQEKAKRFKEDPPMSMSPFTKALEIAPDRPFTPVAGVPTIPKPIIKKKPKDPLDEILDELPKPAEKLDMRTALTYAPDRPYTPIVGEEEGSKPPPAKSKYACDSANLNKPLKPEDLPTSFRMNVKEPKPPSYYPPSIIQEFIETGEKVEKEEKTETKTIEKHTFEAIPGTQQQTIVVTNPQEPQVVPNFAPYFQGFTCSFQNKSDYSQFSVEVSTTPPVPTPPPVTPISYLATVEQKPSSYIQQTERIVQESKTHQESSLRQEMQMQVCQESQRSAQMLEGSQIKAVQAPTSKAPESKKEPILKQKEDVVRITPTNTTMLLKKPEKMPQYQQEIQAAAESDLLLLKRKEESRARMEQQKKIEQRSEQQINLKTQQQHAENVATSEFRNQFEPSKQDVGQKQPESKKVPIITIAPENNNQPPKVNFNSVENHKPRRVSPHRSITPSMVHNAPPLLPYYQEDLVHHYHAAVKTNILDPKSPDISRSPTPNIIKMRTQSPGFRGRSPVPESVQRMQQPQRSATPEQIQKAKETVQTSVYERQSQAESCSMKQQQTSVVSQAGEICQKPGAQGLVCDKPCTQGVVCDRPCAQRNICERPCVQGMGSDPMQWGQQTFAASAEEKHHSYDEKSASGAITRTDISQKAMEAQLQAQNISQTHECEESADGLVQIQRKKTVKEEYEHVHKEKTVEIQKNTTKYAFNKINEASIEETKTPMVQGMHVTNPSHIESPFKRMVKAIQQDPPLVDQKCEKLKSQSIEIKPLPTTKFIEVRRDSGVSMLPVPPPTPTGMQSYSTPVSVPQASSFNVPSSTPQCPLPPMTSGPQCCFNKPTIKEPSKSTKHVSPPRDKSSQSVPKSDVGTGSGRQAGGVSVAPKKGRGVLNPAVLAGRIPLCGHCHGQIRGPFITALGKIWCPNHFACATPSCKRPLQDLGFVEEKGQLYCEYCFEQYLAPPCSKCGAKVKGDCLKAIGKNFHPECFNCVHCGKLFGNSPFFLEDGSPYCDADWNELFTTKCFACGFPIEAGDRWVEALSNNYHSLCFNCTMCKKNLEGQSFFAKGGRPYCKTHAR